MIYTATVDNIGICWKDKCQSYMNSCTALPSCVNAVKYLDLCEEKLNCNQNSTSAWNETCWTYCNYEATPATTDKTWIAFEKCHMANCTNGTTEYIKEIA